MFFLPYSVTTLTSTGSDRLSREAAQSGHPLAERSRLSGSTRQGGADSPTTG